MVRPTGGRGEKENNGLASDEINFVFKENQRLGFSDVSLKNAAEWLSVHLDELPDPIVPAVCKRFDLSNDDANKALRRARVLRHARAL